MKTVVGSVDSEEDLERTLDRLQDAGFAAESVKVVRDGDANQPEDLARVHSIQPHDTLVVIRTADEHAPRAMQLLIDAGTQNVEICADARAVAQTAGRSPAQDRLSSALRWSARILGLLLIGVVASFFIGEGLLGGDMPDPSAMSLVENLLMLALLMTLMGLILAWRWEAIGGLIIVVSVLLFEGIDAIASGSWSISPLNPLFLLVAALFLWDWRRDAGKRKDSGAIVTG